VPYTQIAEMVRPITGARYRASDPRWDVRTGDDTTSNSSSRGVWIEASRPSGVWRGRWPAGVWIDIPGGRDLCVHECTASATHERQKLGRQYVTVSRARAEELPPLGDWCRTYAERSIHDSSAFWLERSVWIARREDTLTIPLIPEVDEPAEDLRRVAKAERACRQARALLEVAQRARAEALTDGARRRSRRRLGQAAGLSYARVQQLISAPKTRSSETY
jgi:hypothetical protein